MQRGLLCFSFALVASSALASGACQSGGMTSGTTSSGTGGETNPPPPPPAIGTQLATTPVSVKAGTDSYECWSFVVPSSGPLALTSIEPHMPASVHHYALFTNSGAMGDVGPFDCSTLGASWNLVSGGGIQPPPVTFPAGTAMPLAAGEQIVVQLHLLNADPKTLTIPASYINLVATDQTGLQEIGLLEARTTNISLPAHTTNVTVNGGCKAPFDIAHIFGAFPQMHALGKHITTSITAAGSSMPDVLSDEPWNYQDESIEIVSGSAASGDQISVTCTYDNPTNTAVSAGLGIDDELCETVVYYYPATTPSVSCGL